MLFVIGVVALAVMLAGGVRKGTVLQVTIAGDVVEDKDDSLEARLFQGDVTLLRDITHAVDRARKDDRITGIMAVIKPYSMGLAKVQEIRDSIQAFRASGKWAVVYMDTAGEFGGGNSPYYLATAFDEIWLSPPGDLNLYGLFGAVTFIRGTLDKLGIYPDFDSIGKYKNAKDIYTEKKMTEAHREATMMYLQDWYDQIVAGVAEGRKLDAARVSALINEGPFISKEALDKGLVDHLGYFDEFEDAVKEKAGGDLNTMKFRDYLDSRGGSVGHRKIAVITGMGIIVTGKSQNNPLAGAIMGSDTITEAFRRARRDKSVKAIVFRVDSPGGSAVASDLIWRETQLARKEKPVVISMSDVAASGGYYVSAGATKVVTQPGTITGSIGVVAGKMVTTGLYDWIGLTRETLGIGDHAGFYYTGQKFSAEEKVIYWKFMNKIYDNFTGMVATGRGMTREAVDKIGQGHVWSGTRAKGLGLVDELGGMSKAIELAKKEAGIPDDEEVRLVYLPEKKTLLQNLLWPEEDARARTVLAGLPREVRAGMRDLYGLSLLGNERVLLLSEPAVSAP
jgi:protease-4